MTHLNRVCVSPCYYFMSLSHTVSEIFSVKEWSDLENGTIQKLGYGFLLEACTGLGLTGNPRVPRVARGFGIHSTGNPRSWVIKYLQSRGVGDDRLRESRGLDLVIS